MDKNQTKRVSGDEIALIEHFLKSREDALIVLRDFFLQLELTEEEGEFIKSLSNDLIGVLEKMMKPTLTKDVPIDQNASMYSRLSNLEQVNPDVGDFHIRANDLLKDYLEQEFNNLKNKTTDRVLVLNDLPDKLDEDTNYNRLVNIMAYNLIIPIVEGRLKMLSLLVLPPEETPEQMKERMKKNSSR